MAVDSGALRVAVKIPDSQTRPNDTGQGGHQRAFAVTDLTKRVRYPRGASRRYTPAGEENAEVGKSKRDSK